MFSVGTSGLEAAQKLGKSETIETQTSTVGFASNSLTSQGN